MLSQPYSRGFGRPKSPNFASRNSVIARVAVKAIGEVTSPLDLLLKMPG